MFMSERKIINKKNTNKEPLFASTLHFLPLSLVSIKKPLLFSIGTFLR